jgi:hypothetical protein
MIRTIGASLAVLAVLAAPALAETEAELYARARAIHDRVISDIPRSRSGGTPPLGPAGHRRTSSLKSLIKLYAIC